MKRLNECLSIYPVVETVEVAHFVLPEAEFSVEETSRKETIIKTSSEKIAFIMATYLEDKVEGHISHYNTNDYVINSKYKVTTNPVKPEEGGLIHLSVITEVIKEWKSEVVKGLNDAPFELPYVVAIKDDKTISSYGKKEEQELFHPEL